MNPKPKIYFYLPPDISRNGWPQTAGDNWIGFGRGANVWTYFSYVAIRDSGYEVHLTSSLQEPGIIVSHYDFLPRQPIQGADTLLVCIRADRRQCYVADIHLVQNPRGVNRKGRHFLEYAFMPGPNYYLPYWPQPGLVQRSLHRGNEFTRIVYFGEINNAAPFMRSQGWKERMKRIGIDFELVGERQYWNDYSNVDAIMAIRRSGGREHLIKPPSKLINAWLAGVPAILSPDSAFREVGIPGRNYLEANTEQEAFSAVRRLQNDLPLREQLVREGAEQGQGYTVDSIIAKWRSFFDDFAVPYYVRWQARAPAVKRYRATARMIRCNLNEMVRGNRGGL